MSERLAQSAGKVQRVLEALGLLARVIELPSTTRTAREAAVAIGCHVEQIAKSLVFRTVADGRPVLVIASGRNRVDEDRLAVLVGEPVEKADAAYVRRHTGYAIGGVPPVGHLEPHQTLVDVDLSVLEEIWAAAGTPHAVFCLTPAELLRITGGMAVRLREGPSSTTSQRALD
jgi:prolyl-tRNA editing enzyme YbaK/EbsC (Cys-tRNA(Pro) deacylase)